MRVTRWREPAGLALWGAVTVATLVLVWHDRAGLGTPVTVHKGFVDFRDTIWQPVRDLVDGFDPYDPRPYLARHPGSQELDLYSPGALLLHAPLVLLPFTAASVTWLVLVIAGTWWAAREFLRLADLPSTPGATGALAAVLMLTVGGHNLLVTGQIGGEVVLGAFLALTLSRSPAASAQRLAVVGTVLALEKPQTGLPLLVLLGALGAWRVIARALALALALAAPVVAVLIGIEGVGGLVDVVRRNLDYSVHSSTLSAAASNMRTDLVGVLDAANGAAIPDGLRVALPVLVLGGGAVVALSQSHRSGPVPAPMTLALLAAIYLGLVHATYDQMLLPGAAVGVAALAGRAGGAARWWPALSAAGVAVVCLDVISRGSRFLLPVDLRPPTSTIALVNTGLVIGSVAAAGVGWWLTPGRSTPAARPAPARP